MWEMLRRTDVERAKERLAAKRVEILIRHEEELNRLDIEQTELERFARLVARFASKYLTRSSSAGITTECPIAESGRPSAPNGIPEHHDALPSRVHDQSSANFAGPVQRLAEDGVSIAALIVALNPTV